MCISTHSPVSTAREYPSLAVCRASIAGAQPPVRQGWVRMAVAAAGVSAAATESASVADTGRQRAADSALRRALGRPAA